MTSPLLSASQRKLLSQINLTAAQKELARRSLSYFTSLLWPVIEPEKPFSESWVIDAICEHLEAVTNGDVTRLLINVFPGASKSTLLSVMWPAWEWGPRQMPHLRYLCASYASSLPERDNRRFRQIVQSPLYQSMWSDAFALDRIGDIRISNDRTGFKVATSVGGIGTGFRGDRLCIDDPNNVREAESDTIRQSTNEWFHEAMSDRLNDLSTSAIVVIQQRTHDQDVSGSIIEKGLDYTYLMIPAEYEPTRSIVSGIGWEDPRSDIGELAWPGRFPQKALDILKIEKGPWGYAGQYQQNPVPRGGNLFNRDWWQLWPGQRFEYPKMDYKIAVFDGATKEKEENDWSACTVWGVWHDERDLVRIMLMHAWQERLPLRGFRVEEGDDRQKRLAKQGLVEKLHDTCTTFKVHRLLIEDAASGPFVFQELQRLYRHNDWATQLVAPKGDKRSRGTAVQPLFTQGLVHVPEWRWRDGSVAIPDWAELVISQAERFPKADHDDLVDTMIYGLHHLRECGYALHHEEAMGLVHEQSVVRKPMKPLYDV